MAAKSEFWRRKNGFIVGNVYIMMCLCVEKEMSGRNRDWKKGNKGLRGEFEKGAFQGKRDDLERKCYSRDGYQGIFRAGRQGGIRDKERYRRWKIQESLGRFLGNMKEEVFRGGSKRERVVTGERIRVM